MQQRSASHFTKKRFSYPLIGTLILILLLSGVSSLMLTYNVSADQHGAAEMEAEAPSEDAAEAESAIDSGDTAWMLTSTALVLFMTIPGLALFYGGLVRVQNVLSVLMQCFALTGIITVIWIVCGYSLAFNTAGMEAGKIT